MSPSTTPDEGSAETDIADGLRKLAVLPDWLLAPLQGDRVGEALRQSVPEFASGALALRGCKIKRMLLKDASGRWVGTYNLSVEGRMVSASSRCAARSRLLVCATLWSRCQKTRRRLAHQNGVCPCRI